MRSTAYWRQTQPPAAAAEVSGARPCMSHARTSTASAAPCANRTLRTRPLLLCAATLHAPPPPAGVVQVLPSLLAFDPASAGLPPFRDVIAGVIPLEEPISIKGTVVKGFGRGSKARGLMLAAVLAGAAPACDGSDSNVTDSAPTAAAAAAVADDAPGTVDTHQELGIPTANVDSDGLRHSIGEAVTGIYAGWASVGSSSDVHKMVRVPRAL